MNQHDWLEEGKKKIASYSCGQLFIVNDLFDSAKWKKLTVPERQSFGRLFRTNVDDGQIPGVRIVDPDKKGRNKYIKFCS